MLATQAKLRDGTPVIQHVMDAGAQLCLPVPGFPPEEDPLAAREALRQWRAHEAAKRARARREAWAKIGWRRSERPKWTQLTWAPPPGVVPIKRLKRRRPKAFRTPYSLFACNPLSNEEKRIKAILDEEGWQPQRPKLRSECKDGPRPCPWVSCRFHLAIDVNESGSLKMNFPGADLRKIPETCALDVADRGPATMERLAEIMNMTTEGLRWMLRGIKQRQDRIRKARRMARGGGNE